MLICKMFQKYFQLYNKQNDSFVVCFKTVSCVSEILLDN